MNADGAGSLLVEGANGVIVEFVDLSLDPAALFFPGTVAGDTFTGQVPRSRSTRSLTYSAVTPSSCALAPCSQQQVLSGERQ